MKLLTTEEYRTSFSLHYCFRLVQDLYLKNRFHKTKIQVQKKRNNVLVNQINSKIDVQLHFTILIEIKLNGNQFVHFFFSIYSVNSNIYYLFNSFGVVSLVLIFSISTKSDIQLRHHI